MNYGIPNTAQEVAGKRPGEIIYSYAKGRHICCSCQARWVPDGQVYCDPCLATKTAWRLRVGRRKNSKRTRDINPQMVEVMIAPEIHGVGLVLKIKSDVGDLLTIRHLESVDVRDAQAGAAKISGYRARKEVLVPHGKPARAKKDEEQVA